MVNVSLHASSEPALLCSFESNPNLQLLDGELDIRLDGEALARLDVKRDRDYAEYDNCREDDKLCAHSEGDSSA